jgi:hypothetical protein
MKSKTTKTRAPATGGDGSLVLNIVDDIGTHLFENQRIARMLGSLARMASEDDSAVSKEQHKEIWGGVICLADRLVESLAEINKGVDALWDIQRCKPVVTIVGDDRPGA